MKLQRRLANERGAQAGQVIESARNLMLVLGLAAAVIGISSAYVLTVSITRLLHEAVQIAQTVAAGDLRSRIRIQASDETGQLLQALDRSRDHDVGKGSKNAMRPSPMALLSEFGPQYIERPRQ